MAEGATASGTTFEHDGKLYRAKPGAVSSFIDYLQASDRWVEVYFDIDWSPWREPELAPELQRYEQIFSEWERAEPDYVRPTRRQVGAMQAAGTRRIQAAQRADEARWEQNKVRYDPDLERARLALLEYERQRKSLERDLTGFRDGTRFPAMVPERRTREISELEGKLPSVNADIARLADKVEDREEVVDHEGQLPRDRRKWNVIWYRYLRIKWVEEHQAAIAEHKDKLAASTDRREKDRIQASLYAEERQLGVLQAIPRLKAEQMCADCYTPEFQHDPDAEESNPCPAWPQYAARMENLRNLLLVASQDMKDTKPAPPKPEPLATLAGDLPLAEVIARLTELQAQHPDAIVKRGRANRWELWPAEPTKT